MSQRTIPFSAPEPLPADRWTPWPGQRFMSGGEAPAKADPFNRAAFDYVFTPSTARELQRMPRFEKNDNPLNLSPDDLERDRYLGGLVLGSLAGAAGGFFGGPPGAGVGAYVGGEYGSKYGLAGSSARLDRLTRDKNGFSMGEAIGRGAPGY